MLNAGARYPAPRCDSDTREEAQRVVKDWICNDGDAACGGSIMWLSGAPGVGKSAIVQTVCTALASEGRDDPDACHFFGRGQGRREKAFYFPATIAYHISSSSPAHRLVIDQAIASHPTVFTETLHSQFQKLLFHPVAFLDDLAWFRKPITVVIDALDEVDDAGDQVALLELIHVAATKLPMRFLIASRPEQQIHSFFHRPDVHPHVRHVRLDEETFKTSRDIYTFLVKNFARIRQSRPGSFPVLPHGELWPGLVIIRRLTDYSDAQFIFPHLIIESIDMDRFTSPHEQLQSILMHTTSHTFSKLDALYHQILSRCFQGHPSRRDRNKALLLGILRAIICWHRSLSICGIADVLDEKKFVVENIIRGPMRCLFKLDEDVPDSDVRLCHKSLRDCVLSRNRAGEFFISSDEPDELYREILSRPPPVDPRKSFSRRILMGVLQLLTGLCHVEKPHSPVEFIARALDVGPDVVWNVFCGPQHCLFFTGDADLEIVSESFVEFLDDPYRSKEFYVEEVAARHRIYTQILSLPPPCDPCTAFSRRDMKGVLQTTYIWCFMDEHQLGITIPEIASVLCIEPDIVQNVVRGPQAPFFYATGRRIQIWSGSSTRFYANDNFWSNVRAGPFYFSGNTFDDVLIQFLSRPPPTEPQLSFSQSDLVWVILATSAFDYQAHITIPDIALALDIETRIVQNVICGPQRALFHIQDGVSATVCFRLRRFGFWRDADRSGPFHIFKHKTDALRISVLSHPAPGELYSRRDLMSVIRATLLFSNPTIDDIASALGISPGVVQRVVNGPQRPFFPIWPTGRVSSPPKDVANFFRTAERSGEFYVSENELDALLLQQISRPPPVEPQKSYSRQLLMEILRYLFVTCPPTRQGIDLSYVASALNVEPDVVRKVIFGPHKTLFDTLGGRSMSLFIETSGPVSSIRQFLLDPTRSGEYYLGP